MWKLLLCATLLHLFALVAVGQPVPTPAPEAEEPVDFACSNCVFEADGVTPRILRAMFLPGADVVENPTAEAKAASLGIEYSCWTTAAALPECFGARNWNSGWVGELAWKIFDNLGVGVIGLTPANFSQASGELYTGPSSYTRCVWEIYLGNVDICVGDFWETDERRRVTSFTSIFDLDTMRLVTKRTGKGSSFDPNDFLGIFAPFEPAVWALVVGNIVFASVAIYMVESGGGNQDYEFEETADLVLVRIALCMLKSIWIGCISFLSFSPCHRTKRWSGRIISFGFGIFIYITVASYAAKLIDSLLSTTESPGLITGLDNLLETGGKLCLLDAISEVVSQVPKRLRIGLDDYGPMLEKLHAGACAGAIIGKTPYQQMVLANQATFTVCTDPRDPFGYGTCRNESHTTSTIQLGDCTCSGNANQNPASCPEDCPDHHKYCDILDTEDTSLNLAIGIGFPVVENLKNYFSAWIVYMRLTNQITLLRNSYINERYVNVCPTPPATSLGLSIEKMSGTYVIAAGLMVLGVLVYLWQNARLPHEVRQVTEKERLDGELENEGHEVDEPLMARRKHVNPFSAVEGDIVSAISVKLALVGRRLDALELDARSSGMRLYLPKKLPARPSANGNGHGMNGNGHGMNGNGHGMNGNGRATSFADGYNSGAKEVSFYEPAANMLSK